MLTDRLRKLMANLGAASLLLAAFFALVPHTSQIQAAGPAVLSLSPSTGTFVVDSTFDVSVLVDTRGQSINAIEIGLKFPPDKLQLVSSSTGKSIIGLWPSLPKYDNQTGTIQLIGGIPNGIAVSKGLITTLTFRVKATGSAVVKFERTKILENDGQGTEMAYQVNNSLFQLILPPPEGPTLASDTHPDQGKWYKTKNVSIYWGEDAGVTGYSYILSDTAVDTPDDIADGFNRSVNYVNVPDGRHYFHIKALRDGKWGGVSHYAFNIDSTAPAEFELEFIPRARTTRLQPVIQFGTTDAASGLSHYELRIIPLKSVVGGPTELFIEASSPYVPNELAHGSYDVLVRAYDQAGNFVEVNKRLQIVPALFKFIGEEGVELRSTMVVPWVIVWIFLGLLILILLYIAYRIYRWHRRVHEHRENKVLPPDLQGQMEELKEYRSRYGRIAVIFLLLGASMFSGLNTSYAQVEPSEAPESKEVAVFAPPIITTLSRNINDEEIFYVGGTVSNLDAEVILYIQNLDTAETIGQTIKPDKEGEWFYRHSEFLGVGKYMLWAQSRLDGQLSPPSPQVQIESEETALKFGSSRISYATFYFLLLAVALTLIAALVTYIVFHTIHGRKKHKLRLKEISEAQESLRRGFSVLNRDIQAELALIKRAKLGPEFSEEERIREEQLLKDMENIQQYIAKEIWDIENVEHVN